MRRAVRVELHLSRSVDTPDELFAVNGLGFECHCVRARLRDANLAVGLVLLAMIGMCTVVIVLAVVGLVIVIVV